MNTSETARAAEKTAEAWLRERFPEATWRCKVTVSHGGVWGVTAVVFKGNIQLAASRGIGEMDDATAALECAEIVWDKWCELVRSLPVTVELMAWHKWHAKYNQILMMQALGEQVTITAIEEWEALSKAKDHTLLSRLLEAPAGTEPDSSGGRVV